MAQGTKNKFLYAYDKYCDVYQIEWTKPYYKEVENVPLIPTTDNVDAIVSNASQHYATVFRILVETGAEGHELENVARSARAVDGTALLVFFIKIRKANEAHDI